MRRRTTLARCAWAGLALAVVSRPAPGRGQPGGDAAGATISLVDPAAAPFSSAELRQALLARLLPDEAARAPDVRVAPAHPGAVTVQVGDRSRVVALGGRAGPAAARVVALVIAELMNDDASAGPEASPRPPARAATPAPPVALHAAAAPRRATRVCVTAGVAKGLGDEELPAGTLDADVVVPLGRRGLLLAPSVGLVLMPARDSGTLDEVSFFGAVGRLLAGSRFGLVDLAGGPLVAPYSIGGATPHAGVLFGAEALARLAAPLSRRAHLIVAARVHAYGNRIRVSWLDGRAYATPRLEVTIGAGFAWDWTS